MPRWTFNAASSKLWVRCVAAVGAVLLTLAWTGILALIADIPTGYGAAQSRDEPWLAAHPADWSRFRVGTSRDLFRYIPGYFVFGFLLICATVIARRPDGHRWAGRRDRLPVLIAAAALLIGALADVVETVLFRRSLTRLLGAPAADVSTLTSITAAMTVVKWVGLAASYLTLIVLMLLPPSPTEGSSTP